MTRAGRTALAAFALAAFALAGCSRQRYEPISADSTSTAPADSFGLAIRAATEAWDSGVAERAAELTAGLVARDLETRGLDATPQSWGDRAEALLDSLGFGLEQASSGGATVVNLFARSNPQSGSWPYLYWSDGEHVRFQRVEGSGLRLSTVAARGLESLRAAPPAKPAGKGAAKASARAAPARPAAGVAALFSRRAALGAQPTLLVWRAGAKGEWTLAQSLGPDSLGRFGTAEFALVDSATELVVRAYGPTPRFDECATCPHVYWTRHFRWGDAGFTRLDEVLVPSPYATFVSFVTALAVRDDDLARARVSDPKLVEEALRLGFAEARGLWRAAPSTDESARDMVFLRGKQEAYHVTFAAAGDEWVIDGIAATTSVIE